MANTNNTDDKLWAAVLLSMVENTPNDVLHEVFAKDLSAREAQMIVEGVQFARDLLGRH